MSEDKIRMALLGRTAFPHSPDASRCGQQAVRPEPQFNLAP